MDDSRLFFGVASLGKLRMQEAWRLELLHSQPRHRLYWITRGQGRVTIHGITRGYGPNTAIFLPANTQAALELPAQLQGLELTLPVAEILPLPAAPFHLRVATMEAQASLTSHIEKSERELSARAPAMDRALLGYGLLISAWMERELGQGEGAVLREKGHHLAELFAQAVEAQFRSGRGVADYAAQLGVTPTHLSRVCRDASGRPAHALLSERLMHEARRLLRDTDLPAFEIAQTLGFSSAAYFTRAFQHAAGQTPSAFRAKTART